MIRTVAFIYLFLTAVSCSPDKPVREKLISPNQLALAKQYREIGQVLHKPLDSIKVHLDKMESAARNESAEYKAMVLIGRGSYNLNKSAHVLAQKNYEEAIGLLSESDADTLRANAYSGLGAVYKNTGEHSKAFDYLYKAQTIHEKHGHKASIASINSHIAQIYLQKNDIKLAKEHLQMALDAMSDNKSHFSYLNSLHILANIHGMAGDYATALAIDDDGIRIADSINSPKLKVTFIDNKANCYMYSNRLDSAQYYFNECLKIDLQMGNPKQIGDTYCNLGVLALFKKDYAEAERNVKKSIAILTDVDHKPNLLKSYDMLSNIYRDSGRLKDALAAKNEYLTLYRTMMNEKTEASLAEYKVVHETEQKEKIIAQNKIEILEKQREVKHRNFMLIGMAAFAFFIAIVGWLIYRQQKTRNRQQQQEHELKTAISQIETQSQLQEQRLSISRDLHDNIGAQLTFIISSVDNIRYAFDLKNTKLENRLQSINTFTKSTIIELRDTIWAMNNSEISFEDLRVRIFNFIEKAQDAAEKISFKFDIDNQLKELRLSSVAGMNIYRTVQEAINNAIKYSDASHVAVAIRTDGRQVYITVRDNGAGFDSELSRAGNGLANMKKRIEDIGGKFSIESVISKGTVVNVSVDMNSISFKTAV